MSQEFQVSLTWTDVPMSDYIVVRWFDRSMSYQDSTCVFLPSDTYEFHRMKRLLRRILLQYRRWNVCALNKAFGNHPLYIWDASNGSLMHVSSNQHIKLADPGFSTVLKYSSHFWEGILESGPWSLICNQGCIWFTPTDTSFDLMSLSEESHPLSYLSSCQQDSSSQTGVVGCFNSDRFAYIPIGSSQKYTIPCDVVYDIMHLKQLIT